MWPLYPSVASPPGLSPNGQSGPRIELKKMESGRVKTLSSGVGKGADLTDVAEVGKGTNSTDVGVGKSKGPNLTNVGLGRG